MGAPKTVSERAGTVLMLGRMVSKQEPESKNLSAVHHKKTPIAERPKLCVSFWVASGTG